MNTAMTMSQKTTGLKAIGGPGVGVGEGGRVAPPSSGLNAQEKLNSVVLFVVGAGTTTKSFEIPLDAAREIARSVASIKVAGAKPG